MIFIPSINDYKSAGFSIKEVFAIKKAVAGLDENSLLADLELRANEDSRFIELIKIITVTVQA